MTGVTARQRLLDAAVEAFAEKGFTATTTRDIASRAGMSPAAVYVYHASKESLLFAVSLDGHQRALQTVQESYDSTDDPIERVRTIVRDFTRWHADNSRVGRIVQYELHALNDRHRQEVSHLRREIEATMHRALDDGVTREMMTIEDIPGTAFALLSLGIDVVRWFEPGGSRSPEELAELYASLATRIVTTPSPLGEYVRTGERPAQ